MRRTVMVWGMLVLAMMLVGWGERRQYGAPIDPKAPVVALKEITKNPVAYKDQEVVLQGNYGFRCCPSDFSYKEGLEVAHVAPQGFDSPKLKPGTPVTISGIVRVGHLPEETEEASGKTEEAAEFYIEATGVSLR